MTTLSETDISITTFPGDETGFGVSDSVALQDEINNIICAYRLVMLRESAKDWGLAAGLPTPSEAAWERAQLVAPTHGFR